MDNIFISHIHQEAALAHALKLWLERTTAGQWKVFVSSDANSLTLGQDWFRTMDQALTGHSLLLVLCSPASLTHLWIGYEVGYGSAKGVPIIPICHSGATAAALPPFLSRFQGIEIDAPNFVQTLFGALQKHVPLQGEPYIPEQDILNAIKAALAQIVG